MPSSPPVSPATRGAAVDPAAPHRRAAFACCFGHTPTREEFNALEGKVHRAVDDARAAAGRADEAHAQAGAGHDAVKSDVADLQAKATVLTADLRRVKAQLAGLRAPAAERPS